MNLCVTSGDSPLCSHHFLVSLYAHCCTLVFALFAFCVLEREPDQIYPHYPFPSWSYTQMYILTRYIKWCQLVFFSFSFFSRMQYIHSYVTWVICIWFITVASHWYAVATERERGREEGEKTIGQYSWYHVNLLPREQYHHLFCSGDIQMKTACARQYTGHTHTHNGFSIDVLGSIVHLSRAEVHYKENAT